MALVVALGDQGPNFDLESPQKASIIDCRAAFLSIGDCFLEARRAFRSGETRILPGPVCCRAAQELNSGCWPKYFGFNPFYPIVLQIYCSGYQNGSPTTPFFTAQETDLSQASEYELKQ
ncbi:hypothetical protein OSB04_021244 [Centaurea solstitialis]|uniref:Prolamin-like domain-containing protein n=1 Tax=Centaurea solstitialis TaxID=347529 RepID=A0AA38T789_9ASTR|nr:hypothetical protein OSB04_021244 [Centaurea solstitialis]